MLNGTESAAYLFYYKPPSAEMGNTIRSYQVTAGKSDAVISSINLFAGTAML